MFMLICMDQKDVDKPITKSDLVKPNSKVVNLIMYLYSIEPDFYAELNNALMTSDVSKLSQLGPFARCLSHIFANDVESKREDRIKPGKDVFGNSEYGFFKQSFILFRGA